MWMVGEGVAPAQEPAWPAGALRAGQFGPVCGLADGLSVVHTLCLECDGLRRCVEVDVCLSGLVFSSWISGTVQVKRKREMGEYEA